MQGENMNIYCILWSDSKVDFRRMMESSVGKFMRKGETGDWKNHLSDDQLQRIIQWERKNLGGTDLEFEYELNCEV